MDVQGAGATIGSWRQSEPSKLARGKRDIKRENINAITSGAIDSKDFNRRVFCVHDIFGVLN